MINIIRNKGIWIMNIILKNKNNKFIIIIKLII